MHCFAKKKHYHVQNRQLPPLKKSEFWLAALDIFLKSGKLEKCDWSSQGQARQSITPQRKYSLLPTKILLPKKEEKGGGEQNGE